MEPLAVIRRESDAFYTTAAGADPTLSVPTCPDWNVADLTWHLGEVQCFWATIVEMRAPDPEEPEKAKPPRPTDFGELVTWGRAQTDRLIQILEATPDDVSVWTWALDDADHTVGFIRRHQVQEAAVHRWDMQRAAQSAVPDPIAADAASDSIDELLAVTLPWCVNRDKPMPGTVHLHCTDTEGEWFMHGDGRVEPIHAKGDVAIRGSASDLLLALYKRLPIDAVEVIGDTSLAKQLIERVNTS